VGALDSLAKYAAAVVFAGVVLYALIRMARGSAVYRDDLREARAAEKLRRAAEKERVAEHAKNEAER
jgi:hypothetical protein